MLNATLEPGVSLRRSSMVLILSYVAVLPMLLPLSLAQHIILVGDGTI